MPTALIYGHSQSGGMGLDVQKLLSKAGWKVVRVTKVGWSDGQLGAGIPELTGSPGQYDRIFYYGGANPKASKEATGNSILANVAKLGGPSKVTVVLAPYNDAKEPAGILADQTTRGWHYEQQLKAAGVKVYRPLLPSKAFWPDRVHVKPYTAEGLELAQAIIDGTPSRFTGAASVPADVVMMLGLGLLLWWMGSR